LMESSVTGQRFILNGENWSFQKLFNAIADEFGKKHPHRKVTPFLGALAWRVEKIKTMFNGHKPILTKETARVALCHSYFQNDKILHALQGFSFTPLQQTIARACKKYTEAIKPLQP